MGEETLVFGCENRLAHHRWECRRPGDRSVFASELNERLPVRTYTWPMAGNSNRSKGPDRQVRVIAVDVRGHQCHRHDHREHDTRDTRRGAPRKRAVPAGDA